MNGAEQKAGRSRGQCRNCSQPLTPETRVHLWDGKDYCRDCVEAACPGMADYARAHAFLEETMPYDAERTERSMRKTKRSFAVLVLVLLTFLTFLAIAAWLTPAVHGVVLAVFVLTLPVAGMAACIGFWWKLFHVMGKRGWLSPIVRVHEGRLVYPAGRSKLVIPMRKALAKCRWSVETRRWFSYWWWLWRPWGAPRNEAVVIEFWRWLSLSRIKAPCGWTPEMRRIWMGFLTLAGVPQKPTKKK